MRCKKCGAVLKQAGELCPKCSQKEKELKADKNVLLKINKKYSLKYILTEKLFELYIIFFILILFCIYGKNIAWGVLFVILFAIIVISILAISKRIAKKTSLTFYETKVVYKGKMLFWDTKRVLGYEEIKDIVITQGASWFERFFQKMFKIGNIYVYPKKGNIISNGIRLEIVDNIDEVIEKIKNVAGDKLK
jgi:hypothetical protein